MKKVINKFKLFLSEADYSDYVKGGRTTLYHYSKADQDTLVLDPSYFGQSAYSRSEKNMSSIPRVFFYTNLAQRERYVSSGRQLYKITVEANEIYNLKQDPERIINTVKHPTYGMRAGIEFDDLFNEIKKNYSGVYYTSGKIDMVAWFQTITANKVLKDERTALEQTS